MSKTTLSTALVVFVLAVLGIGLAAWKFVSLPSTGLPLGPATRVPDAIVQIIQTRERFLPSLHRNPDKDRFALDLLIIPLSAPDEPRMIRLLRQQQRNALQPMTKVLGADGDVVWVQALDLFAVHLRTSEVRKGTDLRKANPELAVLLDTARFDHRERLLVLSPDGQQAYAIDPTTLRASAVPAPPRPTAADFLSRDGLDAQLCGGGRLDSTRWLAVLGPADAGNGLKPGFSLPRDFAFSPRHELRQLYRGESSTDEQRPRIQSVETVTNATFHAAGLARSRPHGSLLRLDAPESVLLFHRGSPDTAAPLLLSRLGPDGALHWSTDTGLGALRQVLPDTNMVALVGDRPAVAGKVPEPILVLIDAATGTARTASLWR